LDLLKELERQNAFIHAVLSQVPAAIVVADAATGKLLLSNDESHRIVRHEYHAGRRLEDYGTNHILEAFRPDGSRYVSGQWPLDRALRGETIVKEEIELVLRDGPRITIRVNAGPIQVGAEVVAAVVAFHDITDRKAIEQTARFLASASATLAGLVDYESTLQKVAGLAVPTFADWASVDMVEPDGQLRRLAVAHVDPAKIAMALELGRRYPPDPEAPHGVWNVLRTGRSEIMSEIPDALLVAGARDEEHLRIIRELALKSFICTPLSVRGQILGVLTFVAAESGRRYSEHDLKVAEDLASRAAIAIENARLYNQLKEADRSKDEFLATLAHELRNPLAPIRNVLSLMRESANGDQFGPERAMAERQVLHLTRLIDDLMDVARISQGKMKLHKQVVNLATIVNQAVETARLQIESRRHQLTVSQPGEAIRLEADPTRLEQILWNLLNNAAKYSEPGSRINLMVEPAGAEVVIRVRDTGIGIKSEMLHRIFGMFVQVGEHKDHAQGGLGIGLSLVRTLVEMHGGSINAHSDGPGQGSEFVVRLPILTTLPAEETVPRTPAPKQECMPCRRILVVDDNVDAAESLAMLLTQFHGQDVQIAYDGPAALNAAEEYRPEVMLLDIGLPRMNGYAVARAIRERPWSEKVVIIALTGWGQDGDRRCSKEAGIDHHLVKPVELAELLKLLAELPVGPD
jgi:signal transduction histidine kinase